MVNKISRTSNRAFGFLLAAVCCGLSVHAIFQNEDAYRIYGWLLCSVTMCATAIVAPTVLTGLNSAWMALGNLLGKVVNPILLAVIFYIFISPVALISRLFGRDVLRLKKISVSTYWIDREPREWLDDSFKNQY